MDHSQVRSQAKQLLFDLAGEVKLWIDRVQAGIVNADVEAKLDSLIEQSGETRKFERLARAGRHLDNSAPASGSLMPESLDVHDMFECDIPVTMGLDERKRRVRLKIAFLSRIAREKIEGRVKRSA
jgi:hypothetical protein